MRLTTNKEYTCAELHLQIPAQGLWTLYVSIAEEIALGTPCIFEYRGAEFRGTVVKISETQFGYWALVRPGNGFLKEVGPYTILSTDLLSILNKVFADADEQHCITALEQQRLYSLHVMQQPLPEVLNQLLTYWRADLTGAVTKELWTCKVSYRFLKENVNLISKTVQVADDELLLPTGRITLVDYYESTEYARVWVRDE